jgi:3-oxoacyl-[acyl-carrier protein] reductase
MSGTSLVDRTALVTGSSRGIGAEIARLFASRGARVALHGRDRHALDVVRARIEHEGGKVSAHVADLTEPGQVGALRLDVERAWGPVDTLVVNAGGNASGFGPVELIEEQVWRDTIDANLTSAFLTVKEFLPGMKTRGAGSVITVSSASAHIAHERNPAAYAAAKAGLESLTKNLAVQAGPHGIRVNCIAPETLLTDTNQQEIPSEVQERLAEQHPLRRLGLPDDVAGVAAYLTSDDSAWVTGWWWTSPAVRSLADSEPTRSVLTSAVPAGRPTLEP